jgi:hypothetical protein
MVSHHLLHRLRALLGGLDGRHVQPDLRCCCWNQRQRRRARRCRGPDTV